MLRTAFAVASVTLVIGVAVWLWAIQHRVLPDVNRVAVVDLRLISPTRGEIPGPGAATVLKAAGGLRVILPVGRDGNYESEILRADTRPILRSSGTTRVEGGEVVLNLRIDLSTLNSGRYLLALRRDGSEWEYYSLTVE